jgi:hypothetical protein
LCCAGVEAHKDLLRTWNGRSGVASRGDSTGEGQTEHG